MKLTVLRPQRPLGPFSIPIYILKLAKEHISKPLMNVFNNSITTGIVPESFKLAKVIPIFKKGSRQDLNNYRPISLLSVFNKILEKLIYKRLIAFIEDNGILSNKQFGFRTKHSTTQTILSIVNKIQLAIEEGLFSCGIFLDLSKAFDTVNHNLLIQKLNYYGFHGIVLNWLKCYLSDRKQYVSLGCTESNVLPVSHSVPQGSVLGPLLFLLYINDFNKSSDVLEFHLFADDSNLFYKKKLFVL